jgi:hypothetical protein
MKKYLMSGIAALSMIAGFTSCSHNDDAFGTIGDLKNEQYAASFTARYGTIDSNNDWGFDRIGVATTRSAVNGRANAYSSIYTFAVDATDDKFIADVPSGVKKYTEVAGQYQTGYGTGTSYLDPSWTQEVNIWGSWDGSKNSGGILYIKGDNDFTNRKFYVAANTEIYLTEGAVLRLNANNASDLQGGCNFYIAKDAQIITEHELVLNNGLHMYNHGTINAGKLQVNMTSVLYNSSIITTGELSTENQNSEIINDGTITATRLHTAGSSHFVNNNSVTISGDTDVDSNDNTWVNNGQYTTNNFTFQATSADVINNCKLTVNNKFFIGLGDSEGNFKLDGSIITKDFELHGPANIRMTSNSVIKVSNEAKMAITKPNYGIYGPTSGEYAVFEAKNVVWESRNNFCVNYFGNLYVVADNHFEHAYLDGTSAAAQANGGVGNCPTYYFDPNTVKIYVNGTKPDYSIAESKCNPGFNGDTDEIPYAVRIICEDLGAADDFDFNDVVFDALIDRSKNKTYIRVMAAGGTLPLYIAGTEVHGLFNLDTKVMINTGKNAHNKYTPQEFVIDQVYASYKDIPVNVELTAASASTDKILQDLKAEKGSAPQKIAVGTNFVWCDERDQIEEIYDNFPEYVTNSATLWQ